MRDIMRIIIACWTIWACMICCAGLVFCAEFPLREAERFFEKNPVLRNRKASYHLLSVKDM